MQTDDKYKYFDKKYWDYPVKVLNDEFTACKYVKQACQRYLDWFGKYEFRPEKTNF